jgi:preprotein translocase subunit SecD
MIRFWTLKFLASLLFTAGLAFGALAQDTGLEYRLKVKEGEGVPFAFDHAEEQYFARRPFITAGDFASVTARLSKNPNTPGEWEVVLTHTPAGRMKFRAVANADRSREFCLVLHRRLHLCEAFPPEVKGLYDRGVTVTGNFDRAKAQKLPADMRREITRAKR